MAGTVAKTIEKHLPQIVNNKPTGRPRKYQAKFAEIARAMSFVGASRQEIAEFLNVTPQTLGKWIASQPDLAEAVKAGQYATAQVTMKLFQRAMGYDIVETRTEINADGVEVKRIITNKHMHPDIGAIMQWLRNRDPEHWSANPSSDDDLGDMVNRLRKGMQRASNLDKGESK